MKSISWFRNALPFLMIVCVAILSNLCFKYSEFEANAVRLFHVEDEGNPLFSKQHHGNQGLPNYKVTVPDRYMAGFPFKFYSGLRVPDGPPVSAMSWLALLANIAVFGAAIGLVFAYRAYNRSRNSEPEEGKPTRKSLSLLDLFVAVALVGGIFAYWRYLDRKAEIARSLANEVQTQGTSSLGICLPDFIGGYLPAGLRGAFARISYVELTRPNEKLVERILDEGDLRVLRISGESYPSALIDRITEQPFIHDLRISGRMLTPENVASIGSMRSLVRLSLMRTNITAAGVNSFTELKWLENLDLIHTDCRLAEIADPPWKKTVNRLFLPHPPSGQGDEFIADDWPKLRDLFCNEYNELKNEVPVKLQLSNMPKLEYVALDHLQKFDLKIEGTPRFEYLQGRRDQLDIRATDAEVPSAVWLAGFDLSGPTKMKSLQIYARDCRHFRCDSNPKLKLSFTNRSQADRQSGFYSRDYYVVNGEIVHDSESPSHRASDLVRNALLKGLSESAGPRSVAFDFCDMRGLDLSALKKNKELISLNFDGAPIEISDLESLKGNESLRELSLVGVPLSGQHVQKLVSWFPNLRQLNCDRMGVRRLRLRDQTSLQKVFAKEETEQAYMMMGYNPLEAVHFENLPEYTDSLDLPGRMIYCHLSGLPKLKGLSFAGPLPDEAVLTGFRDLEYFAGGGATCDDELFEEILACKALKRLTLCYANVSIENLLRLGELKNLRELNLVGTAVDERVVAMCAQLPNLVRLDLSSSDLANADVDALLSSRLVSLQLNDCNLPAGSLQGLSKAVSLKSLGLAGIGLDSQLFKDISKLTMLAELDLSRAEWKQEHVDLLAAAPRNFETLKLQGIDASGVSLLPLQPFVRTFDLRDTYFEPQSMDFLVSNGQTYDPDSWQAMQARQKTARAGVIDPRLFAPGYQPADQFGPLGGGPQGVQMGGGFQNQTPQNYEAPSVFWMLGYWFGDQISGGQENESSSGVQDEAY